MSSFTAKNFPAGFPYQVGVSGTTNAGPLLQAIPSSPTDISTKDTYVFQISLTNGSGGALTFTLSDKQGTPIEGMKATSIANASTVSFNWEEGLFCKGGVTWGASGAGLTGQIVAFYRA